MVKVKLPEICLYGYDNKTKNQIRKAAIEAFMGCIKDKQIMSLIKIKKVKNEKN